MRDLLRSRRGSVAFATVIALVPLIGVVSLGAEAGSWYVTKQHAQNAADAAAYSGALKLECKTVAQGGGPTCTDTQTEDYRAKQFAAQNAFCNGGDTTVYPGSRCASLPTGISQQVSVVVSSNQVQATVSQTQPAYLAQLLGLSTVTIGATAIAQVDTLTLPCVLSLTDPLVFQGNTTIKAPNCGLSSNATNPSNAVQFTGNSTDLTQVKSVSAAGGCSQTGGTQCNTAITFASPTPNPLSALDTAIASLTTASFTGGACGATLKAYGPVTATTGPCYNNGWSPSGTVNLTSGVYFFDGAVKLSSSSLTITGTVTLILLPKSTGKNGFSGASLTINGGPTIQLTGLSKITASQVPAALGSTTNLALLSGIVIYDPETTTKNQTVNISGSSTTYFSGITYAPNADIVYQGNTTQTNSCNEVIAKGITLSGSSNFDNSTCSVSNPAAVTHYVHLVQ
ncbi:pilus assembly protein TadG-related protein [Bradyrhizobium sp. GCM10027634]|uniref:pilus assembly protein TadG-related protein n=1 Tax=unclassified Bradyrhizobium TaxID=2631580 RepID=UPI00263B112F|nr:pilus assembly protein TadG-related protein [Bradyrhizobium sp. WYCCWR 12677]MDN5005307.1 pilus assembly protein TadG-related protein [Bradyrhizobium sp. WYCCWR 12677]